MAANSDHDRPKSRCSQAFFLIVVVCSNNTIVRLLADKSDVIEDQQVILFELGDRALERELAPRDLQALDEIANACEQHTAAALDERETDGGRKMALAAAGGSLPRSLQIFDQPLPVTRAADAPELLLSCECGASRKGIVRWLGRTGPRRR